jgi:hypothetical protein
MKCGFTYKLDPSQALWHKHQHSKPHREHLKFLTTYTGTNNAIIIRQCTTKILTPITHQSPRSPQQDEDDDQELIQDFSHNKLGIINMACDVEALR